MTQNGEEKNVTGMRLIPNSIDKLKNLSKKLTEIELKFYH